MSLSTVNSPSLVAALTAGCYSLFPALQATFQDNSISWTIVKTANLLAYGVSLYSVSQPGRYDGQALEDENAPGGKEMKQMSTGKHGRTLVAPAGWAFVIWAPIFLGEMVMVGSQWFIPESSPLIPVIREVTGPYIFAQAFQTLWTASFRPKYNSGVYKYISAMNLSGIAISLSFCHATYSRNRQSYSTRDYWTLFLPLSLHFGWTTAAALVNWNGMYALEEGVSSKAVAWLGHLSVVAATAIGVGITLQRSAPVYGGVVAWALSAVSSGMAARIQQTEKEDETRVGVLGAKTQQILCTVGAITNVIAVAYISFRSKKIFS